MEQSYVGIDVSKGRLEVVVTSPGGTKRSFHVANTDGGCRGLLKQLERHAVQMVAVESTGGCERRVRQHLADAAIPTAVLNPQRAKAFAQFKGTLAKTDKVDAMTLAQIAEEGRLEPSPLPDPEREALAALVGRRRQVVGMLTMEKNRLAQAPDAIASLVQQNIAALVAQRQQLEHAINDLTKNSAVWQENHRLLTSINGIGPTASAAILAYLPEIGLLPHKKLAALVGVAPYAADSGARHGTRFTRGGRGNLRHTLYMAALSAVRYNPQVRSLYLRLMERGKPKKLALVACMHKLLRIANAVIRRGMMWDPDWRNTLKATAALVQPVDQPNSDRPVPAASTDVKEVGGLGGGAPQLPGSVSMAVEPHHRPPLNASVGVDHNAFDPGGHSEAS